jgi:hypothetical protein
MVLLRPVCGRRYWEQQVFTEQHTQRRTDTSPPSAESPASLVAHYHRGRTNEDCSVCDGVEHADRPPSSRGQGHTGTTRV